MTTRWHKKLVSYSFIAIISIILVSNMFITLWILTAIGKKLAFYKKEILKSTTMYLSYGFIQRNLIILSFYYRFQY